MSAELFTIEYLEDIEIKTYELNNIFDKEQLPLRFKFNRQVNHNTLWETNLNDNSWANFPNKEMIDVIVLDNQDNKIFEKKWNVIIDGNFIYRKLWNYCKNKQNTKGVVIGTHNGEFGEWVPVAIDNLSNITLIEASKKQFDELINNFLSYNNLTFINELVTKDGKDTIFYEGGKGYTNTVLERVIEYWEKEPITKTIRRSTKFSDLITPDINWIHTDVEGIDIELIMSLSDEQLSHLDIIIYEYNNSNPEERELIKDFLTNKRFINYVENGVGIGFRE